MDTGGPLLCFGATATLRSASGERARRARRAVDRPGHDRRPTPTSCCVGLDVPRAGLRHRLVLRAPRVPQADGDRRRRRDRRRDGRRRRSPTRGSRSPRSRPTIRRVPEAEAALDRQRRVAAMPSRAAARRGRRGRDADQRRARLGRVPPRDGRGRSPRRAITAALTRARGGSVPIPASPACTAPRSR